MKWDPNVNGGYGHDTTLPAGGNPPQPTVLPTPAPAPTVPQITAAPERPALESGGAR